MHFLVGLGILAGLVWFAFGAGAARTARALVCIVLAIPVAVVSGTALAGMVKTQHVGKLELLRRDANGRLSDEGSLFVCTKLKNGSACVYSDTGALCMVNGPSSGMCTFPDGSTKTYSPPTAEVDLSK